MSSTLTSTISSTISTTISSPYAFWAPVCFCIAYFFVIIEEFINLRKSKPMMIATGILWVLVATFAKTENEIALVQSSLEHYLLEYGQLLLFILVAVTYINVMEEFKVFHSLRVKLIQLKLSYRQLFWITGFLAFFISSFADNLTTAIALASVVVAVGIDKPKFISLGCLNVVIAANAGGAFSPFGDLTTLMVWQAGILQFKTFFHLFLPSVINYIVPAFCMYFALPKDKPLASDESIQPKKGAYWVVGLFLFTIFLTVILHHFFALPPVIGMMFGLGLLQIFAYLTQISRRLDTFDIFPTIQRVEWDTLLFFYGVILSVGALATLGYLEGLSTVLYGQENTTVANIIIGILSALIDNIPVMFAVISMHPQMSEGQWLLVTLTTGVGGSLLAVGSAAGVALMGQAKGMYSFFSHLRWAPVILLGYFASILFHLWWNADLF